MSPSTYLMSQMPFGIGGVKGILFQSTPDRICSRGKRPAETQQHVPWSTEAGMEILSKLCKKLSRIRSRSLTLGTYTGSAFMLFWAVPRMDPPFYHPPIRWPECVARALVIWAGNSSGTRTLCLFFILMGSV